MSHEPHEAHKPHKPYAASLLFLLLQLSARRLRRFALRRTFTFQLLTLLSCSDAERLYDSFPAYFIFRGTNTVPQLNTAMGGLGEFCTIQDQGSTVLFSNLSGSTPVNKTAVEGYQGFRLGRAGGFIVGLPTLMSDTQGVVCYDIVCPNCYKESSLTRPLELITGGRAQCRNCKRTYDLNNQGLLASGDAGRRLFRYNCSHHSYTLIISNR